jgi:tetratricopeptide (TPR) repeat protein
LPPDLPDYTCGTGTVASLGTALTTPAPTGPPPAVVISGRGGAGKTSMAVRIAHQVADQFPDGQLFVTLRGTDPEPATTVDALARALRGLGDTGAPSTDLEEWTDRYRARIAGRRVLVVLDDAGGAAQVHPFLPTGPGSAVLVTTRARLTTLAGVHHHELGLMGEADAVALLGQIVGAERVGAEPEQVRVLVRLCDRLPLALRVVGARLAARPHWPIARLVTRMSDERRRLDELVIDDLAVRAGLAVSYRSLDRPAQQALLALAYLDPPDFAAWTPAAMLGIGLIEAEDILGQLLDVRLIEVVALGGLDTRYRMHDLVRLYARELARSADAENSLRAAVTRAVMLGLDQAERRGEQLATITVPRLYRLTLEEPVDPELALPAGAAGVELFEAEEPNLVAAVERAAELGLDQLACALADAMIFASFAVRNNFTGWERAHRAALVVARSSRNQHGEAVIECGFGQLRYKEDRFADAEHHFERALTLFRQERDHQGEIAAMNGLGSVCREQGKHTRALTLHTQAGSAWERRGDTEGAAHSHYGIGFVHRELGEDSAAFEHLNRALELFTRSQHVRGQAISARGLGLVHRARGELDAAERYCVQAHRLADTTGDELLSTYTAQGLAKVWIRQGVPGRGSSALERGLAVCIGWQDRLGAALIRRTIGEMHLAAGDPADAREALSQAYAGWLELDLQLWQGRTLRDLGAAQALLGDTANAHRCWARAGTVFDRYRTREHSELVAWRRQWGCRCDPATLASATGHRACAAGSTVLGRA